jgi:AraC-like DNA-binding protein
MTELMPVIKYQEFISRTVLRDYVKRFWVSGKGTQLLYHTKGQFRVAELADRCHVSARQLERQFNEATGVSPKTLARSIRFDAIRNRLMFHPTAYLTELAYEKLLADALSEIRGEGLWARCYSFTCARDTGRHADHSLKGPIEGGFGCVAQSRGQFADVSTLLSQDRQRRVHPPARHITHNRFTEHLGETIRK